jgi:GGDEF domain-containing protein
MTRRVLPIAIAVVGVSLAAVAIVVGSIGLGLLSSAWLLIGFWVALQYGRPKAEAAPVAEPAVPEVAGEPIASALVDPVTGLFNASFFHVAVETRITAARRQLRPVAVVLLEVREGSSDAPEPTDPLILASIVRRTLRDADTACRLDDGRLGLVLEDTPEDGAIWAVERLRRALNASSPNQTQFRWAGIACYPAHAFDAKEALAKAERAFFSAREWKQDRIEVAPVD